ncbi:MAG: IPTL-CTERM sorting domain-containing protein [Thermodesulfobacteriota bacterium]
MPRIGITLPLLIFLTLSFLQIEANAQTYLPVGPQTNVPENTVTDGGWVECYRDRYSIHMNADEVLESCPGDRLMLSCRETGSPVLTLLAQGERSDVTFDTGENIDVTHIANGVGWYFNVSGFGNEGVGQNAWGFVRAGDSVLKANCDVDTSGANDERLCWHLQGIVGGYRCGATEDLNDSAAFERIVYTNSLNRTIPTLSEWGLVSLAVVMGIAAVVLMRRRKAAA